MKVNESCLKVTWFYADSGDKYFKRRGIGITPVKVKGVPDVGMF